MAAASTATPTRLLTAAQLAEHWQISRQSIYNFMAHGLPSVKLGRARRFDIDACAIWLAQQQEAGGGA